MFAGVASCRKLLRMDTALLGMPLRLIETTVFNVVECKLANPALTMISVLGLENVRRNIVCINPRYMDMIALLWRTDRL